MSDPAIFNAVLSYLNRKDPEVAVQLLIDTYGTEWGEEGFPLYMQYGRLFRKIGGKKYVQVLADNVKAGPLSQYKVVKFSGWLDSKLMKF